jgi:hypothetical protein
MVGRDTENEETECDIPLITPWDECLLIPSLHAGAELNHPPPPPDVDALWLLLQTKLVYRHPL